MKVEVAVLGVKQRGTNEVVLKGDCIVAHLGQHAMELISARQTSHKRKKTRVAYGNSHLACE